MAMDRERANRRRAARRGAVANTITGAALTNVFGLVGAALVTTTNMILWNAGMALFIWRVIRWPGSVTCVNGVPKAA
jgi:hypothetical protein